MVKEIPLTQGKIAIVDNEDCERVNRYRWHASKLGRHWYATSSVHVSGGSPKKIYMHRYILSAKKGQLVDHKNGNGLDNRRSNIRICTRSQNNSNAKPRKNAKSKYKGVQYNQACNSWMAYIAHDKKSHYLGLFESEVKAAKAYDKAAKKLHGEFAKTNF